MTPFDRRSRQVALAGRLERVAPGGAGWGVPITSRGMCRMLPAIGGWRPIYEG